MQKILWIFLIILVFNIISSGQIFRLKGTAVLKDTNGKQSQINQKNFRKLRLRVGQQLKADSGGEINIWLCQKFHVNSGKNWFVVPDCVTVRSPGWLKQFSPAGRSAHRGEGDFILFPIQTSKEENIIRSETALFRWGATNERVDISFSIEGKNETIWAKNNVDGKDRFFTSDEMKNVLREIRNKQPEAKVQLRIQTSLGTENVAVFRIFSSEQEMSLQEDLNGLKVAKGILLHLARADVFSDYKLYIEAASELEEALKLSPESIDLLNATASAQDRAGNFERRDEIDGQLKAKKDR